MSPSAESTSLLRDGNYRTLLVARSLALGAYAFHPVALAFGILNMPGGSAGLLSIVMACQLGPTVILMLIGGAIADRQPRARMMAFGEACIGTGVLGLAIMLLTGFTPAWLLCVCAALTGVSGAFTYPALTGIIPDLVAPARLAEANSYLQGAAAAARLLGVVAGGAAVALLGGGLAMVAACLMYYASAVLSLRLPSITPDQTAQQSMLAQIRDGWSEFSSRQWLWVGVAAWSLMFFSLQSLVGVIGPVIANQDLGGAFGWSLVLAGQGCGALLGMFISLRWRPKYPVRVGMLFALFSGPPGILLGLGAPIWLLIAATAAMGFGFQLFSVYWTTSMQMEVPTESLSRVASYDAFGSMLLGPLGLVLAGPAVEAFGAHSAAIVCGTVATLVIGSSLLSPGVRQLSPSYRSFE